MGFSKDQKKKLESTTKKATNLDQLKPMAKKNGAETLKPRKLNSPDLQVIREREAKAKREAAKLNKVEKLVQDVTNRYRVTAREARDIVTSVSNLAQQMKPANPKNFDKDLKPNPNRRTQAVQEVAKQVGEVAKAAVTGKKGTSGYTGKQR